VSLVASRHACYSCDRRRRAHSTQTPRTTVDATPSITSGLTGMSVMQTVRATLPWLSVLLVFLIIVTYE
jgi:hypothetical protein